MNVTEFLINTYSTGTPLVSTAKRYRPSATTKKGYILIFAHGTGFHKEHWEPIIQRLYAHGGPIIEAWAIDSQTHGAAATLNRDAIDAPGFTYSSYHLAEACANLYKTHLTGTRHPIVLIGHSAGAASVALVPSFWGTPTRQPFSALILVEPAIWPGSMIGIADSPAYKLACSTIPHRRKTWASRDAVRRDLALRAPWRMWDSRILDIYIEHGFEEDKEGVSLRCRPHHECQPFANQINAVYPIPELDKTRKKVPVHVVYGERNDLFTREKQDSLLRGRKFASVTRIPGAGHLVVQEAPDAVGDVLLSILEGLQNQRYVQREFAL
ncbi:alpha/beta-hydrolase [Guyanagaster necrorhizus]|uniref:Alpha/beta-hydrolase n=1 Tax=Guyanagaster necrorhizus TaxID=856835 RepID=A0A9P8APB3_9AGAR|nr:alpha/beta-hydrolase [Guyanagaster necrorhizus MCA 3950]KAG7441682.1 alpha/beta-hydrolase [Guyanagaster necrorhizus MCA 3950]